MNTPDELNAQILYKYYAPLDCADLVHSGVSSPWQDESNYRFSPLGKLDGFFCMKILLTRWNNSMLNDVSSTPLQNLLEAEKIKLMPDYDAVIENKTGTTGFLQAPMRFYFQTPQGCGGFSTYAMSGVKRQRFDRNYEYSSTFTGMFSSSEFDDRESLVAIKIPAAWGCTGLPLIAIPLQFLRHYIRQTKRSLTELIAVIEEQEALVVMSSPGNNRIEFGTVIQKLHISNTNLIKLERRWQFECRLSSAIQEVFEYCWDDLQRPVDRESRSSKDLSTLQARLSKATEYDLSVLPRRIQNTFTAIYNLMAQGDTRATIQLAEQSASMAEAALRDSSSMKTIAIMTLVFLPATFLCSFFSMTFFSWQSSDSKVDSLLWVYFAVAIPLTLVVTLTWHLCTRRSREKVENGVGKKQGLAKGSEKMV